MASINLIQQLQERGLVAQVTDEEALAERLAQGPIALYCGFDPTADSLHLGHLVPLLCLKRFQLAGHKPVALVGGATGLIGDPSFKAAERKLNTTDTVNEWVEKIRKQVSPFLDFDCGDNSAIAANNYDWFGDMNVLTFLRDIGKHFSVNQMINKEAVKQRLNRDDVGISFTEFSYNLLQGYDFAELHRRHQVVLQIGGSDQWGNITSGIDLTRRMHQQQAFGLTVPLITKADGTKFGKTEGGAVWLAPEKTSPYKFYQFWINTRGCGRVPLPEVLHLYQPGRYQRAGRGRPQQRQGAARPVRAGGRSDPYGARRRGAGGGAAYYPEPVLRRAA
ncbi:Tyrosine--tRNA ligase [Serratia rubidaea]|nr:Tyrosine--tRNA ligase [Serratia rubidaea]